MNRVLFASDLHARPDNPGREKGFLEFLATEAKTCDALYLLGDIFEFGFVFQGEVLPQYKPLIEEIATLAKRGVEVFFLGGNHDFWVTSFLRKTGIRIIQDGEACEIFGKRIQLFHGILKQKDPLSRFADRIMRNPDAVWTYSLLFPKIGFAIALKATHFSRERNLPFPQRLQISSLKVIDPGADIIISGHHHQPVYFRHGSRDFYCIGNWIESFTYLEMTPDRLELKAFRVNTLLGG